MQYFIVGRDHTGVGDYYSPKSSHKIFDKIGDIGIKPIIYDSINYSSIENKYVHENELYTTQDESNFKISGSEARNIFKEGKQPPEWFMRKEVSNMILDDLKSGKKVFVE